MTKEIICINVGQAGVQMSNAAWELFCVEHGLDVDGFPRSNIEPHSATENTGMHTFFHETNRGRLVPRAINIDLEPTVIDEIRTGAYKNLWHPSSLMSGSEDAANNFSRGRYSIGRKILPAFFKQLLKQVRECQRLHGFIMMNSLGGGTGSGLSSLILDKIDVDFTKHTKVNTVIYPSPQLSTAVVEPYNSVLSTTTTIDLTDVVLLCDNEALYDICHDKLRLFHPVYTNINRIISQLFSSLTVTFRFGSSLDHDLVHLQTNLVPFPRIHFPFANYAPLTHPEVSDHDSMTTYQLTRELFEPSNQLLKCDISKGKYIACCLQYRGAVAPREINLALLEIKHRKDVEFVDWCPTGFKVGLSPMPPGTVANSNLSPTPLNVAMFSNSTAIEQSWDRLIRKFDLLYHKKAFVHWFVGEGMEEAELQQARLGIREIQSDYQQLGEDTDVPNHSQPTNTISQKESPKHEPLKKDSMKKDSLKQDSVMVESFMKESSIKDSSRKEVGKTVLLDPKLLTDMDASVSMLPSLPTGTMENGADNENNSSSRMFGGYTRSNQTFVYSPVFV